jgi:hypothetical protein
MMTTLAGFLLLLGLAPDGRTDSPPAPESLARRAAVIKPIPDELRWQQIPWLTDLAEAQKQARAERRPIFLWVTGDDPLERC